MYLLGLMLMTVSHQEVEREVEIHLITQKPNIVPNGRQDLNRTNVQAASIKEPNEVKSEQ